MFVYFQILPSSTLQHFSVSAQNRRIISNFFINRRKGRITLYLEYQSVCPFVRICVGVHGCTNIWDHSCGSGFPDIPSSAFPSFLLSFPACGSSFPGIPSFLRFGFPVNSPFFLFQLFSSHSVHYRKKIRRRSPPNSSSSTFPARLNLFKKMEVYSETHKKRRRPTSFLIVLVH